MIIRNLIILLIFYINFGLIISPPTTNDKKELTISECAAKGGECDESKGRQVCGTDDQTYPSRCHLIRVQCSGHQVSLKHRGPCKECFEVRTYALKHRSTKFIPRCRLDGTYSAVQCLEDSGCWCSDSSGKPITNTSVRHGKPNCRKYSKPNVRRSPSSRSLTLDRRACTKSDQVEFNINLLNIFQKEYQRYLTLKDQTKPINPAVLNDKNILEWKFLLLDTNQNHFLDKNEFRELKRLVKKIIKPKRCGRSFGKFCDIENDDKLNFNEWSNCLSRNEINHMQPTSNIHHNSNEANLRLNQHEYEEDIIDEYDEEDYDPEDDDSNNFDPLGLSSKQHGTPSTQYLPILLRPRIAEPQQTQSRESDGDSDCISDRTAALEEQNNGSAMYIPECTPDGRYQRVQCYLSTGYCWCVHEDTGKNIPGTSVKDKRPQCDSIYQISRPMKGCPEPKKSEFLKNLKDFLKVEIVSKTISNSTNFKTDDEKLATLSFVFLDKNKNGAWERKEWKLYRDLVKASKSLKKCGKKMPRYCDVNSDKKITLSEWLNCLQTPRQNNLNPKDETRPTKGTKLNGPNPLESYLKE